MPRAEKNRLRHIGQVWKKELIDEMLASGTLGRALLKRVRDELQERWQTLSSTARSHLPNTTSGSFIDWPTLDRRLACSVKRQPILNRVTSTDSNPPVCSPIGFRPLGRTSGHLLVRKAAAMFRQPL
jgi:hypothetical protein